MDASCSTKKQLGLLEAHIRFYERIQVAINDGKSLDDILEMPLREELANLKFLPDKEFEKKLSLFYENLDKLLS